jgi:hypothetical protein
MSKREEYQTQMGERLDLWDARFEALKTKAGKEAPPETKKQLEQWHTAGEAARAKLAELKSTIGDKWDLVKEEMDKAWHAIKAVLDHGASAAQTFSKEEIQSLTSDQQDAILEALVVAVVANGRVGQDEVARLKDEVKRIPWGQPKEAIIEKAQAAQTRVNALSGDSERVALLKSIAARLPPGPVAEKTIATMGLVMGAADHSVDAQEQNTLITYALAFGINKERFQAIAESIRG